MRIKFFTTLAAALSLVLPAAAQRSSFRPGEIWPDDKGVHINAHGGGVLLHDGVYYWFGEHKTAGRAAIRLMSGCTAILPGIFIIGRMRVSRSRSARIRSLR